MSILVLCDLSKNGYISNRFLEDSRDFPEITVKSPRSFSIPFNKKFFEKYRVVFFFTPSIVGENCYLFSKKLKKLGKIVINETHYKIGYISKTILYTILSEKKMRVPRFVRIFSPAKIKLVEKLGFPLVAKHAFRHRGSEVKLIKDRKELKQFLLENKKSLKYYVFQEFVPYKRDIRLIFVGDCVLGAIQRIGKDFRANLSLGGRAKEISVGRKLKFIANKVSKILHAKVFSIDILESEDGKYYVIDYHNFFQFKGFEEVTGKKVPKSIYKFLVTL